MIDPQFIIRLKGKDYPQYAGVLDAATKAGLKSLSTTVLQIPSPENGHLAVVEARAEFDDGRWFVDVGDCSPASTSPQLASAAIRLASTRAKGRALRDAINVGMTMYEELPDDDDAKAPEADPASSAARPGRGAKTAVAADPATITCNAAGCDEVLTEEMVKACRKYWKTANYCHPCGRQMIAAGQVDFPQQKKSAAAEQGQSATG
jgi:hypothetical protein